MEKVKNYDKICQFISSKVDTIPQAFCFNFENAVNNGHISKDLADKIIVFVQNHPYFSRPEFDIVIDQVSSFTSSVAEMICDVILANFYPSILSEFLIDKDRNGVNQDIIFFWFYSTILENKEFSESGGMEYCAITKVILCVNPTDEDSIVWDLRKIRTKNMSKSDWDCLYLASKLKSHRVRVLVARTVRWYITNWSAIEEIKL